MYTNTYYKDKIRLVHPITGSFIGEYFPGINSILVVSHKKTSMVNLNDEIQHWEKTVANDTSTTEENT